MRPRTSMDGDDLRRRLQQSVDAHFAAVGKVAAFWSEFERCLQMTIWRLAGVDAFSGSCITSRIDGSVKLLECIIALLRLKGVVAEDLQSFFAITAEVEELQGQRNRIVNNPWSFRIFDALPRCDNLSADEGAECDHVPHSTQEVDAVADRISDLLVRFEELLTRLRRFDRL